MELTLTRQPVFINETLLDASLEQPLECDVLLPDYCPDIGRILKCTLTPVIISATIVQNRLVIEGSGQVTICYTPQGGGLRSVEYKIPFSRTVEMRSEAQGGIVSCRVVCDYVNCRAVTGRRLDIRGAATIIAKVTVVREEQVVVAAMGCGIQLKKTSRPATRLLCQGYKSICLSEEMEIGSGKPCIAHILRMDVNPKITDAKVIAGKVVMKGETAVKILYRSVNDTCEVMEYCLPINQMADISCAEEGCTCHISLEVCSQCAEPRADQNGEDRLICLETNICAAIRVHKDYDLNCVSDCYSTKYECSSQSKTINIIRLMDMVEKTVLYKESMELPENATEIIDIWCKVNNYNCRQTDKGMAVSGSLCLCMLCSMENGQIGYFDKNVDFEDVIAIPEDCGNPVFDPDVKVVSCAYSISGHSIEVRCECMIHGCLYNSTRSQIICDLTIDQRKEKQRAVKSGLYVYLADEGEGLWEIAKRYNTSVQYIMEENELKSEKADGRTMLLIPVL